MVTLVTVMKYCAIHLQCGNNKDSGRDIYSNASLNTMEIQNALETFMGGGDGWKRSIYGRICTTESINNTPTYLSDNSQRKTVFVFGADTVKSATEKDPFELLVHLGLLPEYIHLKACAQQASYWLVLLKHLEDDACSIPSKPSVVPATWDGLKDFILQYYPLAVNDITQHWGTVISTPIETFEKVAGFKFIKALENVSGNLFMSYSKFSRLERPVRAWQVRCFLYCELRVFELFKGDGFTYRQNGCKGEREYMAPNLRLSDLREEQVAVIPLNLNIPVDVHNAADQCNIR